MKTESKQKPDSSRRIPMYIGTQPEKPKELYLKIPYSLLNILEIGLSEKVLLAHFYSFGAKGCWQSNATLARMFLTSPATISRWIANVRKFIQVKCPKGYYRTIWVKSHPDVAAAGRVLYEDKKPDKSAFSGTSPQGGSNPLHLRKNGEHPTQKCATTNNNTIKETTKNTTALGFACLGARPRAERRATPSPLPCPDLSGQAQIEQFKRKFGIGKEKRKPPSPEEFERMRHEALKQLKVFQELKTRPFDYTQGVRACETIAVSDIDKKEGTI